MLPEESIRKATSTLGLHFSVWENNETWPFLLWIRRCFLRRARGTKDSAAWKRHDSCMVRQNFPGQRELRAGQTEKKNFHRGILETLYVRIRRLLMVRIKGSGLIKLLRGIKKWLWYNKDFVLRREIKLFCLPSSSVVTFYNKKIKQTKCHNEFWACPKLYLIPHAIIFFMNNARKACITPPNLVTESQKYAKSLDFLEKSHMCSFAKKLFTYWWVFLSRFRQESTRNT